MTRRGALSVSLTRGVLGAALCLLGLPANARSPAAGKIKHVIIIMQENRSFDSYFGTFPGADGIPSGVCMPIDPSNPQNGCIQPYHNGLDANAGGPHSNLAAQLDLDDGITHAKLDGFVAQQIEGAAHGAHPYQFILQGVQLHDVMGYHTAEEIPNYWAYAKNFVLQDHMFAGVRSSSFPIHVDMTSEWVAKCADQTDVSTCYTFPYLLHNRETRFPWANFFQLLDTHNVSWKYYLGEGTEPDCESGEMTCEPVIQNPETPSGWNPAKFYSYVREQPYGYRMKHIHVTNHFLVDIKLHKLPQVVWLIPSDVYSEHPPHSITAGMMYVTALVNAVMNSSYWNDTAIFISWDDWGGFYDHVVPPNVDTNNTPTPIQGYGQRVPGLLVSAYARHGYIDHGVLSFDSYPRFIEDVFMDGARLVPAELGLPDKRPTIRDALRQVRYFDGTTAPIVDLADEFDFTATPQPPLVLTTLIPSDITASCNQGSGVACTVPQVTVSWNAVPAPNPSGVTYRLFRDGQLVETCDSKATSCVDTPGSGDHLYRVLSIDGGWNMSPLSPAALATVP